MVPFPIHCVSFLRSFFKACGVYSFICTHRHQFQLFVIGSLKPSALQQIAFFSALPDSLEQPASGSAVWRQWMPDSVLARCPLLNDCKHLRQKQWSSEGEMWQQAPLVSLCVVWQQERRVLHHYCSFYTQPGRQASAHTSKEWQSKWHSVTLWNKAFNGHNTFQDVYTDCNRRVMIPKWDPPFEKWNTYTRNIAMKVKVIMEY